jgi:hypothetical protein
MRQGGLLGMGAYRLLTRSHPFPPELPLSPSRGGQGAVARAKAARHTTVPILREKQRKSQTRWGSGNGLARARNGPFLGALLGSLAPAREQGGS